MEKGVGTEKELDWCKVLVERKKKKGSASEYMKGEERFLRVLRFRDFWRWQSGIVKVAVPVRLKKKGWKWKLGTSFCWLTWTPKEAGVMR